MLPKIAFARQAPRALSGVFEARSPGSLAYSATLAGLQIAALLLTGSPAIAATAPSLGSAQAFAVLGASAITNTGASVITGDVGISPNTVSSVTGFPPATLSGVTHFADAVALQAQTDTGTAFNNLAGQPCNATIAADLGGSTLTPGVYCSASTMGLTGTLTLDAQGNPNAVFVFKVGSALTTASNSQVRMINGGQSCNVFWQIGSSATLGTASTFAGNLLALTSVTLTSGVNASSRILARTGAVTLDSNTIAIPVCSAAPVLATTAISTQASPGVVSGGTLRDTATLSAGVAPTGSITFQLFGPDNATCSGAPTFSSTVAVNGNGNYTSADFTSVAAGIYRWIASYSGDSGNAPSAGACNAANESATVSAGVSLTLPTLSTQASASVASGGLISDTATLAAGAAPTGSITFQLFGPNNATCSGAPAFSSTVPVSGNGNYNSANFTSTAIGTYRWLASYSGDSNNAPVSGACNDANESVVVSAAGVVLAPTVLSTQTAPALLLGGLISDTATLTGGVAPTGTITFRLFGPNNATCSGAAIFSSTVTILGNGSYNSATFSPTAVGVYRWIANYSGDANNAPAAGVCNDANENVMISAVGVVLAPTVLSTRTAPALLLGGVISDTATLSGGVAPTGTITFRLFGPDNATCSGTAIFSSTVTILGNGSYNSATFSPTTVGVYRWIANYSGDAGNAPATGNCNDANENVTISATAALAATTLTTQASTLTLPAGIHDTATLAAGVAPGGTITFSLFGPNNATCSGAPVFSSNVAVTGNGSYSSGNFLPPALGIYRWIASYSGDANNAAFSGACNDANESVTIAAPVATAIPTLSELGLMLLVLLMLAAGMRQVGMRMPASGKR